MMVDDRTYDEEGERNDGLKVYDLMDFAYLYFEEGDEQACLETAIVWAMSTEE